MRFERRIERAVGIQAKKFSRFDSEQQFVIWLRCHREEFEGEAIADLAQSVRAGNVVTVVRNDGGLEQSRNVEAIDDIVLVLRLLVNDPDVPIRSLECALTGSHFLEGMAGELTQGGGRQATGKSDELESREPTLCD